MKQDKNVPSRNGLKNLTADLTPGLVGEFKLARNAVLFWSAILLLPSD